MSKRDNRSRHDPGLAQGDADDVQVRYGCFHHPDKAYKGEERMVTFRKAEDLVKTKCARIIGGPGEQKLRDKLNPEAALAEAPRENAATRTGGLTRGSGGPVSPDAPKGEGGDGAKVAAAPNIGSAAGSKKDPDNEGE